MLTAVLFGASAFGETLQTPVRQRHTCEHAGAAAFLWPTIRIYVVRLDQQGAIGPTCHRPALHHIPRETLPNWRADACAPSGDSRLLRDLLSPLRAQFRSARMTAGLTHLSCPRENSACRAACHQGWHGADRRRAPAHRRISFGSISTLQSVSTRGPACADCNSSRLSLLALG